MKFPHYYPKSKKCTLNLSQYKVRFVIVLNSWQAHSLHLKQASEKALSCTGKFFLDLRKINFPEQPKRKRHRGIT